MGTRPPVPKENPKTVQALTVRDAILRSHRTAVEHGWWSEDQDNLPTKIALIHSEVSEALEEYRAGRPIHEIQYEYPAGSWTDSPIRVTTKGTQKGKPAGTAVELADALIRIFDLCAFYSIPLEEALEVKMQYNETRPHRHGGKKI